MELNRAELGTLTRETLRDPQGTARRLMAMDLPVEARWMALAIVVLGSVLLTQVVVFLLPEAGGFWDGVMRAPLRATVVQGAMLAFLALGMARIGGLFGGRGSFADALLLVAWLEFVLILVQVVQLVAMLVLPFVSVLIGIAGAVLFFWLLTNFTAALHGFRSLLKVFAGILGSFFVAAFVLVFLMGLLGIAVPAPGG